MPERIVCEAKNCERLATGIVHGETKSAFFCSDHMAEHEAMCKRLLGEIEVGVDPSIAVRREQVRKESKGDA